MVSSSDWTGQWWGWEKEISHDADFVNRNPYSLLVGLNNDTFTFHCFMESGNEEATDLFASLLESDL